MRIIRIAGALNVFFATGFVGASHGGDIEGSNQGSATAALSASGNPVGGHAAAGITAVLPYQGIREHGYVRFQQNESAGDHKKRTCLCAMQ